MALSTGSVVAFKLQLAIAEPIESYDIREYETAAGRSPFTDWLEGLRDRRARARIDARLARVRLGHLGDHRSVGDGVYELRLFYGPGYRVYFGFEFNTVILLLVGGTKGTQRRDIATAKSYWADYQRREDGEK
jgi:putative addiction module killer protein